MYMPACMHACIYRPVVFSTASVQLLLVLTVCLLMLKYGLLGEFDILHYLSVSSLDNDCLLRHPSQPSVEYSNVSTLTIRNQPESEHVFQRRTVLLSMPLSCIQSLPPADLTTSSNATKYASGLTCSAAALSLLRELFAS